MNKQVYLFNRFLFSKHADFYVLAGLCFLIGVFTTTTKNWDQAYLKEESRYSIIDSFATVLFPAVIFIFIVMTKKGI